MSDGDAAVRFHEYSDADLPEPLRIQVLAFLRIVWPEGFTGPHRFRDWVTQPGLRPHHLLVAGPDGETWTSDDVILTRPTSPRSASFRHDLTRHPLRVAVEW